MSWLVMVSSNPGKANSYRLPGDHPRRSARRDRAAAQIEGEAVMDIGVFQLLPRGRATTDREVGEQALWEVDFAERHGFESVWVTEHHFSGFGSIGVPSVYAAGIAQRTRRIRIGYGVAVVPLHHPLRLAEEMSWVDHLSEGRLAVGVGPGFSAFEFGGFGVP